MKNWKKRTSIGLALAMAASMMSGYVNVYADDVIELRWLTAQIGEHSEAEWLSNVVEGFNKEYEGKIKINVDGVAGGGAEEKLHTDAVSGTMPDIFMLNADAARFNLIADAGAAADLTEYFEKNPDLWDRVDKDAAAAYTDKDGKLLGLPYARSYIGILYNTAMMEEAGVTEIPATWEAFFETCQKLKENGVYPVSLMTAENSWNTQLTMTYTLGSSEEGSKWLKETKPETADFTDPAFIEAVAKIQTMFKDYTTPDAVGATASVACNNFMSGMSAVYVNGPWILGDLTNPDEAYEGLYDDVVYSVGPENSIIASENIAYAIGSTEPEKIEAAFEVLKYIAREDVYAEFLSASGNSPTITMDTSLIETDPLNAALVESALAADYQFPQIANCVKAPVIDAMGQFLPSLADGSMTPEEFAAELQNISDQN